MPNLSRRQFLAVAGTSALGAAVGCAPSLVSRRSPGQALRIYVGTSMRSGRSEGIYVCNMDPTSGSITLDRVVKGVASPTFVVLDRTGERLYSTNDITSFQGEPSGAVTAFAVDRTTGDLQQLNQQSARGGTPVHLSIDATNRFVFVSNYGTGSAAVLPIRADGSLGPAVTVVQHRGWGGDPRRQASPRVHSVTMDRANRLAYIADLGMDRVMVYRFDQATGALAVETPLTVVAKPGSGPRHFTFDADWRHAYLINEINGTVTVFAHDAPSGRLTELQTISTLPAGFQGQNTCAELHLHPSGRFLYGSNRGHDSIVVYSVAPGTGLLSLVQHQPATGRTPVSFAIAPDGRFLLAANQMSDSIAVLALDPASGRLEPTGQSVQIPSPTCVRFA